MPELAIGVGILEVHVHDVGTLEGVSRLEGPFPDPPGLQVAQFDAVECLPLARLDKLVLENGTRVTVEHDLQSGLEFVG